MHARDSEVLFKGIKRYKVIVDHTECSLVCHKVFNLSECLADKGRTPLGVPTGVFLEPTWTAFGLYILNVGGVVPKRPNSCCPPTAANCHSSW